MADLADITLFLYNVAIAAVYPNGTLSPSVGPGDVRVQQGWPDAKKLDLDVAGLILGPEGTPPIPRTAGSNGQVGGPCTNVSIYPVPGGTAKPYQIMGETYIVKAPVFGTGFSVAGNVITVTGTPGTGEYLTVICDRKNVFSASGVTVASIISQLAAQAVIAYPGTTFTTSTLTIPAQFAMTVRQGGIGTLGQVTWRQRQGVQIIVWAPNSVLRDTYASAIDNLVKQNIKVTLPDTSQAIVTYLSTVVSDDLSSQTVYRRTLTFEVEYATIFTFPGYVITSMDISLANYNNSAIVPVIV